MDRLGSFVPALLLVVVTGAARGQAPVEPAVGGSDPNEILWVVQPPDPNRPGQTPPVNPPPGTQQATQPTPPAPPRLGLSSRVNWKAPMLGDFPGLSSFATLTSVTTVTEGLTRPPGLPNQQGGITVIDQLRVAVPVLTRAGVKVSENESPIPQDRVFAAYNFYYRIPTPVVSQSTTAGFNFPGAQARAIDPVNDVAVSSTTAHVVLSGFEKTFLDGRASVGIRVPMYFSNQNFSSTPNPTLIQDRFGSAVGTVDALSGGLGGYGVGDMSVLVKYALMRNEDTGNLLTVGMAVTVPTGRVTGPADVTSPSDTLLQPFLGYVVNFDRAYLHAFHGVIVPTNPADITLLTNDIGVGYRWLEGENVSVIPTVEVHVTTPLTHRDGNGPYTFSDLVVLTAGSHFAFNRGGVLTLGVATPVTGPRPFQVEAQARLNWYY